MRDKFFNKVVTPFHDLYRLILVLFSFFPFFPLITNTLSDVHKSGDGLAEDGHDLTDHIQDQEHSGKAGNCPEWQFQIFKKLHGGFAPFRCQAAFLF